MKSFASILSLGLLSLAVAQEASPTESVGCEPHGDHWHCDGPAQTSIAASTSAVSSANSSPVVTSSAASTSASTSAHTDHDSHSEEHSDEHESHAETGTPAAASPTESSGCEPHGDHWHCAGPVSTAIATSTGAASSTNGTNNSTASGSPSNTAPAQSEETGAAVSLVANVMTFLFAGVAVAAVIM